MFLWSLPSSIPLPRETVEISTISEILDIFVFFWICGTVPNLHKDAWQYGLISLYAGLPQNNTPNLVTLDTLRHDNERRQSHWSAHKFIEPH